MLMKNAIYKFFSQLDVIEFGTLTLTTPDGKSHEFQGSQPGPDADMVIHRWQVISNMLSKGDIGLADDYRNGLWDTSDLIALTSLALQNRQATEQCLTGHPLSRLLSALSYLFRINTVKGSKKNIHAHYDLGNAFYELWLDPSMTYSSAIFNEANQTLTHAQNNKYDRILGLLDSDVGNLLEIGCGWGGFAERALENSRLDLKGITLSEEQHRYAKNRVRGQANIALEDYRHQTGKYDFIVSIEMFEAVGERYWPTYFSKIASLLNSKGKAVIQTITMNERDFPRYRRGGDFIRSFIFPGGMLPSPSRFQRLAETAGLKTSIPHFFGHDYASTLKVWLDNFDNQKPQIMSLGFDEPFIRLWRFYLAACISGFLSNRTDVMQIELSHA